MDTFPWKELAQRCDTETALCLASLCSHSHASLRDFFQSPWLRADFSAHPRKRELALSALLGRCIDCRARTKDLIGLVPYYHCESCFSRNRNSVTEVVIILGRRQPRNEASCFPAARHRFGMPAQEFGKIKFDNVGGCILMLKSDIYAHALLYWGSLKRMRAVERLSPHARARLAISDPLSGSRVVTREAFDRGKALKMRLADKWIKLDYQRQWPAVVTDYIHDRGPTLDQALREFFK